MRYIRLSNNAFSALFAVAAVIFCTPVTADVEAGKKAFVKCAACHAVEKDISKIGPSLHGVFRRKAGTLGSYVNYSEPMKASGVVWNEQTIEAFVKNPRKFIKGTRMLFIGIKNDAEISNLIAYLKSLM